MTLYFAKQEEFPSAGTLIIIHLLVTNLNWASLNLPAPLPHCEIVNSTLPASHQHPLTPKQTNTLNQAGEDKQMLATREKGGWVLFLMNTKALAKGKA